MLMAVAAMVGLAPVMSNYPIVAVSPVSLLLREEWGGGWRGQSENTAADTWQETVIIWLEEQRRSSSFVDWLQRHRFALFEFLCVLFTSYFWVLVFWFFECHMLPPTSCFFIIFPGSILCVVSHTSIFSLWGPPLCETNTNTMSWSWGKVIKQLSISSGESIDNIWRS